jgi:drug/metabolite transporter (DMT)-like permease
MNERATLSTALGFLAVVLWSTTIAVSRSVTEQLGPVTAGAAAFLVAGVLGCGYSAFVARELGAMLRLPRRYLLGCGGLFVLYELCLYLAIGLAAGRQQVLEVGVINYLWPGLTLAFAVPLLGRRAGPLLVPGVLMAFAGTFLAMTQAGPFSWSGLAGNLRANRVPYLFALVAAVSWALYSNLARRWAGGSRRGAVPLFLLAAGVALAAARPLFGEVSHWQARTVWEVLYLAVFTSLLAYAFWERAMRRGDMTLVAAVSYVTPLLSTGVSCVYLGLAPGAALWAGCGLVVAGAVVCKLSVGPDTLLRDT